MKLQLLFSIGNRRYAMDTSYVVEVIPKIQIQKIPQVVDYVLGLINFGGIPIPVVDLSLLVIKTPCIEKLHSRIILLKNKSHQIGILGERVTEVREMPNDAFCDSGVLWKDLTFMGGIANLKDEVIQEINVPKLFDSLANILET